MKKLVLVLLISFGFMLTACNTVQGLGEDIQDAGEAMEKAAN
jgi:predicted small secreted protein